MRQFRGIVESPYAPSPDMIWVYQNECKYFSNGKWELINTPKITEVEKTSVIEENNYLPYIILEVGKTKKIKSSNLDILNESTTNFVKINDGFGVYTFEPNTGGQAHIITAYGSTIYYSISKDGSIEKGLESPDIYLEYVNAGGKKTYKEFINELVDLIG